jgi:hypothetical protein
LHVHRANERRGRGQRVRDVVAPDPEALDAADEDNAVTLEIRADELVLDRHPVLIVEADRRGAAVGGDWPRAASRRDRGDRLGGADLAEHRLECRPGVLLDFHSGRADLVGCQPLPLDGEDPQHEDAEHRAGDQQLRQGETAFVHKRWATSHSTITEVLTFETPAAEIGR